MQCQLFLSPTDAPARPTRTHRAKQTRVAAFVAAPPCMLAVAAIIYCMAAATSFEFEVFGKVQGVFFRKYTQAKARELGLRGWCDNQKSGTVLGEAHGDSAAIDRFKHWLQEEGSPKSKIDKADFRECKKQPSELPFPFEGGGGAAKKAARG